MFCTASKTPAWPPEHLESRAMPMCTILNDRSHIKITKSLFNGHPGWKTYYFQLYKLLLVEWTILDRQIFDFQTTLFCFKYVKCLNNKILVLRLSWLKSWSQLYKLLLVEWTILDRQIFDFQTTLFFTYINVWYPYV